MAGSPVALLSGRLADFAKSRESLSLLPRARYSPKLSCPMSFSLSEKHGPPANRIRADQAKTCLSSVLECWRIGWPPPSPSAAIEPAPPLSCAHLPLAIVSLTSRTNSVKAVDAAHTHGPNRRFGRKLMTITVQANQIDWPVQHGSLQRWSGIAPRPCAWAARYAGATTVSHRVRPMASASRSIRMSVRLEDSKP